MPKSKKKGPSKKSKKKQRLEQERLELARQQEEELLRQAELRKKKLEEEARIKELKRKRREEELRRLESEKKLDEDARASREKELTELSAQKALQHEWKQHIGCSNTEDVRDVRQLNSFFSLWQQPNVSRNFQPHPNPLTHCVQECERGLVVANELEAILIERTSEENMSEEACDEVLKYYLKVGEISNEKINCLTLKLLNMKLFQEVLDKSNDRTEHFFCYGTQNVKFGFWISNMANVFRNKKIEFEKLGLTVELPKELAMKAQKPLGLRFVWTNSDGLTHLAKDNEFETFGGVFRFDILSLPEGCVQHQNSRLQHFAEAINVYEYGQTCTDGSEKIMVKMTIPENLIIEAPADEGDPVHMVWWNGERWEKETSAAIEWNEGERSLSFVVSHLKPLSLANRMGTDSGFLEWRLRPVGVERSLVTLVGSRFKLEIEVTISGCQLMPRESDHPIQLESLYEKTMSASALVKALRELGINIWNHPAALGLPLEIKESVNFASNPELKENSKIETSSEENLKSDAVKENLNKELELNKVNNEENEVKVVDSEKDLLQRNETEVKSEPEEAHPKLNYILKPGYCKFEEIEKKAYIEMASIGSCFEITSSHFNVETPANCVLFQLRKLDVYKHQRQFEEDTNGLKLCLVTEELCVLLKSKELDEKVDLETPDDEELSHESHISLRRCIDPISTSDITKHLGSTSLRFKETLRTLLTLTRPLQSV